MRNREGGKMKVTCYRCEKEIEKGGAILVSDGSLGKYDQRRHPIYWCRECWKQEMGFNNPVRTCNKCGRHFHDEGVSRGMCYACYRKYLLSEEWRKIPRRDEPRENGIPISYYSDDIE